MAPAGRELKGAAVMMRFERQRAATAIHQSTVFDGISLDDAMHLVEKGSLRSYDPGQLLLKQGEVGDAMFVVTEGEVVVVLETLDKQVRELTRRYRGQVVGEFALVSPSPRSASCVAAVATTALCVSRDALRLVMEERPDTTVKPCMDRLFAGVKKQ